MNVKPEFIESIRISWGEICHLNFHQSRFDRTRLSFFGEIGKIELKDIISVPATSMEGEVKCRITYTDVIESITFSEYNVPNIKKVKVIHHDEVCYAFKYLLRPELDKFFSMRSGADEILIFKNEKLTDAYYFNIVLEKSDIFYTPAKPLLKGVMRDYLLQNKLICEEEVTIAQLPYVEKIHLINAMNPLGRIVIDPLDVIY